MKDFVLDASIALSWCFVDEATPFTIKILDSLEKASSFVPGIWPLELGNVLVAAEKRKRITYSRIAEFIAMINDLNITIDQETASRGFHEILSLAHSERLTTYDAAYLELAMRLGLPLASKDQELNAAAKRLGVALFDQE